MLLRVALGPTLSASVFIVEGVVLCISEFNLLSWNEIAWGFERGGVGSPGCPSLREERSRRLVLGTGCAGLSANTYLPPGQVVTSVSTKVLTCLINTVITCFMMKIKCICNVYDGYDMIGQLYDTCVI